MEWAKEQYAFLERFVLRLKKQKRVHWEWRSGQKENEIQQGVAFGSRRDVEEQSGLVGYTSSPLHLPRWRIWPPRKVVLDAQTLTNNCRSSSGRLNEVDICISVMPNFPREMGSAGLASDVI
jgi:hypothetical protein